MPVNIGRRLVVALGSAEAWCSASASAGDAGGRVDQRPGIPESSAYRVIMNEVGLSGS